MTPYQTAHDLIKKYHPIVNGGERPETVMAKAKDCALIAVDQILYLFTDNHYDSRYGYYEAVKQEIEKL